MFKIKLGDKKMKEKAVTLALLAGLLGTGGCAPTLEETVGTELTLKVGERGSCGWTGAFGLRMDFRYAGMSDDGIFTVVEPMTYNPDRLYHFPVGVKKLAEGLTALEVTQEYLKVKCE